LKTNELIQSLQDAKQSLMESTSASAMLHATLLDLQSNQSSESSKIAVLETERSELEKKIEQQMEENRLQQIRFETKLENSKKQLELFRARYQS